VKPVPERRLRIGYVSPNFSRHSVGYFVEPLIAHHDRERYEIICYYNHRLADETTARIRALADHWHDIPDASDERVERTIREDGIDILVDLAGHSKANRLGVFARRPAPVQMTWLGYPDTTGVTAIDYRITDPIADPAPEADECHTERLLRLGVFLCYQPPRDSAPVSERDGNGDVVFASFNSLPKLNEPTIRMWSRILEAVPRARLVLKAGALNYSDTVDRVVECFERNGIGAQRLSLHGWIADRGQHLQLYGDVDIALDTSPYNGTTTTCEALWMGVPVVSLAGTIHMSRVGATILCATGLQELVASGPDEYVDIAVALAGNPGRRRALRRELRGRLESSPLLDHEGYARQLEHQYRQCWNEWCNRARSA
jgi:predicted O-linked N-acetylglucosamine transferase (SPINDLY family)